MTAGRPIAKRLVLTAVVALLVVGAATVASLLASSGAGIDDGPAHPEYDADRLAPDRLDSAGQPNPRGDVGVVLFDRSHGNRFGEADVGPLVGAIDSAGGEVRFTGLSNGFEQGLDAADVLVIADPGSQYGQSEVDAIEQFVDDGGRVVILGEPNRRVVESQGLQAELATRGARLTTVASRFGISFGTQYLYDMENNDGNFKDVVVSPPTGVDESATAGVERVALYTPTAVQANGGTVLLRTSRTAERGNDEPDRAYPVAVRSRGGGVIAVGDKTFLSEDYYAVADNEVFVQRLVEFMAGANHRSGGPAPSTGESPTPNGSAD